MIRLVILSTIFLIAGCPLKKGNGKKSAVEDASYDIPPPPPVPPENYCYELHQGNNGADITTLQLMVMGDSAFGTLRVHQGQINEVSGKVIGTLYSSTFLATYIPKDAGKIENQEWKVYGDSIYRKTTVIVPRDSTQKNLPDSLQVTLWPALHKVACK